MTATCTISVKDEDETLWKVWFLLYLFAGIINRLLQTLRPVMNPELLRPERWSVFFECHGTAYAATATISGMTRDKYEDHG